MAIFKYAQCFTLSRSKAFDLVFEAHQPAPYEGIYQCVVCGREAAVPQGQELPADHDHTSEQGYWQWRLVAYAEHDTARSPQKPAP
jgi:hypothetical protein